ncbi:MAG: GNAT family N-acetyltransferase [Rubrobacteraceae bacterium]
MTTGPRIEVRTAVPDELAEPLALLEESLRNGEPVPPPLAGRLARAVEGGDLEVLAARSDGRVVAVAVLSLRPNVSLGAIFASIEDLYVRPEMRRRGVGRALLGAVEELCRARGVSYVEVQTDSQAALFYEASGYETEADVRVLSRSYAL